MIGFNKKNQKIISVVFILAAILTWMAFGERTVWGQGWPDRKIRLLSDGAFALVETDVGDKIRHCPHHDLNDRLDAEQLIFVLGTFDREKWLQKRNESIARQHLEKHYDRFKNSLIKQGLPKVVNINTAALTELVALPQIGPVFAVRIVEYRETHGVFLGIEDIKKVDGIGQGTFSSIRHYIIAD